MKKFKVGDKVIVKDIGKIYTTYKDWAELHDLSVELSSFCIGSEVKINAVGFHGSQNYTILYGITDGERQGIISEYGLKKKKAEYEYQILYMHFMAKEASVSMYHKTIDDFLTYIGTDKSEFKLLKLIEETRREIK